MPRRINRFNRLNKLLRATNGTIPTTGELSGYYKFVTGQNKIDVKRPPVKGMMKMVGVGVIPFGDYPSTGTASKIRVGMTVQAEIIRQKIGTKFGDSDLGLERDESNMENNTGSFYPALIKVALSVAGANPDSETSAVTGEKYKRMKARSGSIPFGRSITSVVDANDGTTAITDIAKVDERDMVRTLTKKLKGSIDADRKISNATDYELLSYSFESELFRANTQDRYGKVPTTLPNFSVS